MDDNLDTSGSSASAPSPGDVQDRSSVDTSLSSSSATDTTPGVDKDKVDGGLLSTATAATGTATLQVTQQASIDGAKEKGSEIPDGSDDKQAKGFKPASDPARRIDEMTNDEAKAFSRDYNGTDIHTNDEDRPASHSHLNKATGQRTPAGEKAYREVYTRGWNDHAAGDDNRTDYSGDAEKKSAYVAGWEGEKREQVVGHQGGDMKAGTFERARLASVMATA